MTEYMNAQISSAIYIIVDIVVKRRNPIFMKLHLDMFLHSHQLAMARRPERRVTDQPWVAPLADRAEWQDAPMPVQHLELPVSVVAIEQQASVEQCWTMRWN